MKGQKAPPRVFRRIAALARPHRHLFFLGLVILILTTLLETAVIPVLFTCLLFMVLGSESFAAHGFSLKVMGHDMGKLLIGFMGAEDQVSLLVKASIVIVVVVLIKCIGQGQQTYLIYSFAYRIAAELRSRLASHVMTLSPGQLDRERSGGLISRITHDVHILQESLGPPVLEFIQAPLSIAIAMSVMFALMTGK